MIGGVVETHWPNLLPMFTELFKRFPFTFQQTKPDGLFPFRLMSIIITGKRQLLHCSNHGDLASPQGLSPLGLFADRNAYYLCRGRECAREREREVRRYHDIAFVRAAVLIWQECLYLLALMMTKTVNSSMMHRIRPCGASH